MKLSFKTGKWLGILIAILSYAYILYRLLYLRNTVSFSVLCSMAPVYWLWVVILQISLLFANIILESKKWQVLLRTLKMISLGKSIKMVLAGFASGIFTPAKIGEPVGRILFLEKEIWAKCSLLDYIGGAIHNVVIGLVGLSCLFITGSLMFDNQLIIKYSLLGLFSVVSLCTIVWIRRRNIQAVLHRYGKFGNTLIKLWEFGKSVSRKDIIIATVLSLVRYLVYCAQMIILLVVFNVPFNVELVAIVPIYFLLITLIPSFFLTDIGVRGSVALFIFSYFNLPDLAIVFIVSALWIINQVIPAIIGSVVIMSRK